MNSKNPVRRKDEDLVERLLHQSGKSINLAIVIINVLIFFLMTVTGGSDDYQNMIRWGAEYVPKIQEGEYWRLFTSMFLHFDIHHLLGNMLILLFLGDYLERYAGKIGYLLIYLGGGLCGNILGYWKEVRDISSGMPPSIAAGASGAVFAAAGAMVVLILFHRGRLEDITIQRMMIMVVLCLYAGFESTNVGNAAHIGGVVSGACMMAIIYPVLRSRKRT